MVKKYLFTKIIASITLMVGIVYMLAALVLFNVDMNGAPGAILIMLSGHLFYLSRRQKKVSSKIEDININEPSVVYLRSFDDDKKTDYPIIPASPLFSFESTEEEQLASSLEELGQCIAIGRPGEDLPRIGFKRLYVDDDEWKETVSNLISNARLVLIRMGQTDGLEWELEKSKELLDPEKLVLLVPKGRKAKGFTKKLLKSWCPNDDLFLKNRSPRFQSLSCLIYFGKNWEPIPIELKRPFFIVSLKASLKPMFKFAFRPIFQNMGAVWHQPKTNWNGILTIMLIVVFIPLLMVIVAFNFI